MVKRYYYPDGSIIEAESEEERRQLFIDFYNRFYYYINRDIDREKTIETILNDRAKGKEIDKETLEKILRWKVNPRYYTLSEDGTKKNVLSVDEILEVTKKINVNITEDKISEAICNLMNCSGIGAVYAISILYFCTGGRYPIYDKYAHIALMVINEGRDFNSLVCENERERQFHFSTSKIEVISTDYKFYTGLLKEWLDGMKYDRKIDQALWTYSTLGSGTNVVHLAST